MFTVNVIHEVRWLPNDVEARLGDLATRLESLTVELETIKMSVGEVLRIVEGEAQQQIDELTDTVNQSSDQTEETLKESKGE